MTALLSATPARLLRIAIWGGVIMAGMEITHERFYLTMAGATLFVFGYVAVGLCVLFDLAGRAGEAAEAFVRRYWADEARHARDYGASLRLWVLLFGGAYLGLLLRYSREAGFVPELEHLGVQLGALLLGFGVGAMYLVRQLLLRRPAPVVGAATSPAPAPRTDRW